MRMVLSKDFLSGLLFTVVGVVVVVGARSLHMGTANQMGPGYFPMLVGGIVTVIGIAITAKSQLWPDASESVVSWEIRPLIFILLAIIAFGLLVDDYGLIAAVAAVVVIARLAGREGSMLELAIMVAVLIAISVAVFVYGLRMPLKLGF